MTVRFVRQGSKEDLYLIQPYYSQKQQAKTIGVCINVMMNIREHFGLPKKEKGRPKGAKVIYKGEQEYPTVILEAVDRLRRDIRISKALSSIKLTSDKIEFEKYITELLDKNEIERVENIVNDTITNKRFIKEEHEPAGV